MKNIKKIIAVMTATAAMCMSMSAFAATTAEVVPGTNPAGITFNYENSTISVTETGLTGEVTLLVLDAGASDTNVTNDTIRYIDQATDGAFAETMGLKLKGAVGTEGEEGYVAAETNFPDGSYPVKLGCYDSEGAFVIKTATLVVTTVSEEEPQVISFIWGDVDGNETVDGLDAAAIVNVLLKGTEDTPYAIGAERVIITIKGSDVTVTSEPVVK